MFNTTFPLALLFSALLALLSLLELGLTAHVANATNGWIDPNNFLVFCSVWSLLVLFYLYFAPRHFSSPPFFHRYAPLGLLAVTSLFWFAGAVAAAARLGAPRCRDGVCRSFQAAIAFAFFIW